MEEKIKWIIEDLKPYKPDKIILFGSTARGESDEFSDIDIILIKDTKESFIQRIKNAGLMLRIELGGVDIIVWTPEEYKNMLNSNNYFIQKIKKERKIIYEKPS